MRNTALHKPVFQQNGYFLLEILITVVILSLGLLGVASMQYTGLRDNNRSNERSLATVLAYDIIDRMRANHAGAKSADYVHATPATAPTITSGDTYDCYVDFIGTTTGSTCSRFEMAEADLVNWWNNSLTVLPGGAAQISCLFDDPTTPATTLVPCPVVALPSDPPTYAVTYTVTIMWDDARTGATGTNCSGVPTTDLACMAVDVEL